MLNKSQDLKSSDLQACDCLKMNWFYYCIFESISAINKWPKVPTFDGTPKIRKNVERKFGIHPQALVRYFKPIINR